MTWSVHHAIEHRTKTILSLVFIFSFLVFVLISYGFFWTIFGFIILFFSLHSYYFPTHYELTKQEVVIKNIFTTQHRKLHEFKMLYPGKNGVLLSPFKRKTFLNQFRGIFLFLPSEHAEIINFLKEIILTDQGKVETAPLGNMENGKVQ